MTREGNLEIKSSDWVVAMVVVPIAARVRISERVNIMVDFYIRS